MKKISRKKAARSLSSKDIIHIANIGSDDSPLYITEMNRFNIHLADEDIHKLRDRLTQTEEWQNGQMDFTYDLRNVKDTKSQQYLKMQEMREKDARKNSKRR